jgi:adenylate kinase family enzyme
VNALPDLTRTVVVGTTGSGKTTFGRRLAALLDAPFIELDKLHWGPNWTPAEDEAFRAAVVEHSATETWVADGNYAVVRDIIWQRATAIIWLDYPLPLVLWRLLRRTLWRTLTRQRLFNDNREPFFSAFFSRHSLFLWALRKHHSRRQRYNQHFSDGDFSNAIPIIFHKPAHAEAFLELVRQVANSKNAP